MAVIAAALQIVWMHVSKENTVVGHCCE